MTFTPMLHFLYLSFCDSSFMKCFPKLNGPFQGYTRVKIPNGRSKHHNKELSVTRCSLSHHILGLLSDTLKLHHQSTSLSDCMFTCPVFRCSWATLGPNTPHLQRNSETGSLDPSPTEKQQEWLSRPQTNSVTAKAGLQTLKLVIVQQQEWVHQTDQGSVFTPARVEELFCQG